MNKERPEKEAKTSTAPARIGDFESFKALVGANHNIGPEIFAEYRRIMDELDTPAGAPAPVSPDFARSNCVLNSQEKFAALHCRSFPICIQVEITNECNLKCIQCGVIHRKKSTLPRRVFDKLWPVMPYLGGMTWLGGEVFVVDYFLGMLTDINRQFPHLDHTIYTNGLLLNKEIIGTLVEVNNLQLKFSVDSIVKETYEQLRNLGKFDVLLANLETLRETYKAKNKKPNMGINVIAMKGNLEQLLEYPDFCRKYGVGHLDISFLADSNPPAVPEQHIFGGDDRKALEWAKNTLTRIEAKCREYGMSFFCNFNSYFKPTDTPETVDPRRLYSQTIVADRSGDEVKYVFKCYWPWSSLYVRCDGTVVPTGDCIIPIGNILTDDFQAIWNGKMMQIYRYKLSRSDQSKWCTFHCLEKVKVNKEILTLPGEGA